MAHKTNVSPMRVRRGSRLISPVNKQPAGAETGIQWQEENKHRHTESLLKNLAVASALVLCAVTLRSGAVPALQKPMDLALTAANDHSLLDDQLGKLSFVSTLFPEAVLVFGEQTEDSIKLEANMEEIVHAWSEAEPYLAWQTDVSEVYSAIEGEVSDVFHGNGEELIVRVSNGDGISCTYGNLVKAYVKTGDIVSKETILGVLPENRELVLEVFSHGVSVDPAIYIEQ